MRQTASNSSNFAGWGDQGAWREPPRGRRRHSAPSGSSGSAAGSSWQFGAAGAWHRSWQQFFAGSWEHVGWKQGSNGSSSGSSFGSGGWGHCSSPGSATASSLQLLGLERGWLASRCTRKLRACYLAKAKALHPDLHAARGERSAASAEARFKEVQAAYEALLQLVSEPRPQR